MLRWYRKNRKKMALLYGAIYLTSCYFMLLSYIPREITLSPNEERIALAAPVQVEPLYEKSVTEAGKSKTANGTVKKFRCKLFGVIPVGQIEATVREEERVGAVGSPVGIYMKMKNVYVAGCKELADAQGNVVNPAQYVVKEGDYIVRVDGVEITDKEQLQKKVSESEGKPMVFTLLRNREYIDVKLQPVRTDGGVYKLGIWVKDDMAGVGTLTYVTEDGDYGALGHGISESGSGDLLLLDYGYLYRTSITKVTPSSVGTPGEITGMISYSGGNRLGNVGVNSGVGIFGELTENASGKLYQRIYPIGYKQEIQRDAATMLFGAEGDVYAYQIMIDRIDYHPKEKNKSFVFHVTEPSLIEKTGGIVQGMSGSPIIQNGKLIGAVTHVFVNDPTKGYGIFIEDMRRE